MLTLPYGLEMVDTLSSSDARQDLTLLVLPVLRNDNRDRLADRVFGAVTEDTLLRKGRRGHRTGARRRRVRRPRRRRTGPGGNGVWSPGK
jgi:hypothetical protein